jgi:lysophospholipase L1-like esterase
MRRLLFVLAISIPTLGPAPRVTAADPPDDFFFRPKDRIVFLGDSITAQYQYTTDVELYLTTRFPGADFFFLNAGIGGDTANGGAGRFQSQVLDENPTAVTINFGMNDGGYGKFIERRHQLFVEKTSAMLEAAKKAGVRVALVSPNAVDRRLMENGAEYLETQKRFYASLRGMAYEHRTAFADQYAVTRTATEKMEKDDHEAKKAKPYYDGFHTDPAGGLLMAWAILTELKAPALVSDVALSAKAGSKAAPPRNCKISDVSTDPHGVSFTRTDEALPLPVQKDWLPVLPYTNELKDLNWYGLKVTGLEDGTYAVKIDGVEVGKYTAPQLAEGVNLGNVTSGPVWEHADKVFRAINDKNRLVNDRLNNVVRVQVPSADWLGDLRSQLADRRRREMDARLVPIATAQAEIYKLAEPKPHKFEVVAVK